MRPNYIPIYVGAVATLVGLVAFTISWNSWEYWQGPLPGYRILLFLGNLTLIYVWHPLFTEEVSFWPKLVMLLSGQFFVVTMVTFFIMKFISIFRRFNA